MKKNYNHFLAEYKGYNNQNSDIFSEEFNLNLKGGEISLFPNFVKNNTDNESLLRQTGNELFLPIDTTQNANINNKDSSEEKYFISTENDLEKQTKQEESIKEKDISNESLTENMSEKETTQVSTEENESSTENLSSTLISLENQKGGNKLNKSKFTETSDSINFPSDIEIESIVQNGGDLEVSDSINFPSEIEIESIVQDGGDLEVSDSINFPSEVEIESIVQDGGELKKKNNIFLKDKKIYDNIFSRNVGPYTVKS